MIPLKQTVMVLKGGAEDDWGVSEPTTSITIKCRIDANTKKILNQEGVEVTASASFLFKGLQEISYKDTLQWSNDLGQSFHRKPLSIEPIVDFGGKVLFTEVVV